MVQDCKWCPKCSTDSHIYDSRNRDDRVIRRRECLNDKCGHRWTTWEMAAERVKELLEIESRHHKS